MSRTLHHRATRCRACGSADLELALPLPAIPAGDDYRPAERLEEPQPIFPSDLYLCRACGLAQLLDVVDPEHLYKHMIYRTAISLGLQEHFEAYARDVMADFGKGPGTKVLDIGSNDGTLLRPFQALGARVLGVEPSPAIAAEANAAGVETVCRYFEGKVGKELRESHGPMDLVTCNNTFANIPDLDDFTEGLRALMAPESVLSIETGYLLDVVRHGLFDNIYHEHLTYFAVSPMVGFFRRHGLELFDVRRVETKGGSIRFHLQPLGASRPVTSRVEELQALEADLGLHTLAPYADMDRRLEGARARLQEGLGDRRRRGERIVGYGASVGTTTFVARLGLGAFLEGMVDDNPAKFGTWSPGTRLEVRSSEDLYRSRPDNVVLLSWRYAEPILKRHQRFVEEGGRFLHAWPEVVV